jgi:hypothetical protein
MSSDLLPEPAVMYGGRKSEALDQEMVPTLLEKSNANS